MVNTGKRRSDKYKAKIDPSVIGQRYDATKDLAVRKQTKYFAEAEKLESKVKQIVSAEPTILHHYYIAFAEEVSKISKTHDGETAQREICIAFCKWWERGLNQILLNNILSLYVDMACYSTGLPWTGQLTVYQAGDDGTYQKGYTLTRPIVKGVGSHRFVDNGDGTITDHATGLMWIKEPDVSPGAPFNATIKWSNAIINCEALSFAGHGDWRLPNINELISIADWELTASNWVDPVFFPNIKISEYWSSTTVNWEILDAYLVDYGELGVYGVDKETVRWVRPVRAGRP